MYKVNGFGASFFTRRRCVLGLGGVFFFFFLLFRDSETFQKSLSEECRDHQNYGRTVCAQIVQKRSRASSSLSALSTQVVFLSTLVVFLPASAVHKMSPLFIFIQYLNNCSSHGEHEQNSSWEHMTLTHNLLRFVSLRAVQRTIFF